MGKLCVDFRKYFALLVVTLTLGGFMALIFQPAVLSNKIALIAAVFAAITMIPLMCYIWDPKSLKWMPQSRQDTYWSKKDGKQAPADELCAICLCLVSEDKFGKSKCCGNYLHKECVSKYYQHSGRDTCCLCQEVV